MAEAKAGPGQAARAWRPFGPAGAVDPLVLLETHERMRTAGIGTASVLIGPGPSGRTVWRHWSGRHGRTMIIAPSSDLERTLETWWFHLNRAVDLGDRHDDADGIAHEIDRVADSGLLGRAPTLLFDRPARLEDMAGVLAAALRRWPGIAAALAATTEDIEAVLLDPNVPADTQSFIIAGLIPLSAEEAARAEAIVARRGPGLNGRPRSAHEAILFGLLEARPATRGLFLLNARLANVIGGRSAEIDFLCESLKLAVEVDGGQHQDSYVQKKRDARKERGLAALGYDVVRIEARHVADDPDRAWRTIADHVTKRAKGVAP